MITRYPFKLLLVGAIVAFGATVYGEAANKTSYEKKSAIQKVGGDKRETQTQQDTTATEQRSGTMTTEERGGTTTTDDMGYGDMGYGDMGYGSAGGVDDTDTGTTGTTEDMDTSGEAGGTETESEY